MPRLSLLALCLFTLLYCADGPPDDGVVDAPTVVDPVEDVDSYPEAAKKDFVANADSIQQDAVAYTRDKSPEALDPERKYPAPEPKPVVKKKPPVKGPAPTNTSPAPAAPPAPTTEDVAPPAPDAPSHASWNGLLKQHVSASGRVDYRGFANDVAKLDAYLETLEENPPRDNWSRNEKLAYWINAYNAYTVKLIVNNMPLQSIRDIDNPWKRKWINIDGRTLSLDGIENEIIRPRFNEPRIHFALVCAAKSCPPLANQAYTAANLNGMLERRTRSFLNDETFNVTQEEVVRLTPIFDWYAQDFGDVRAYVNRYLENDIPEGKKITYTEYDWSLNN